MPGVELVLLTPAVLRALLEEDLEAASAAAGVAVPVAFLDDRSLWRLRLEQVEADPAAGPWAPRAIVRTEDRVVVGHAGYHGPPDARGMAEIGYSVLPEHRRRGHARATIALLLADARASGVAVVRASVSPQNAASLALVRTAGFTQVGEQMDEEDGLELVFERPA